MSTLILTPDRDVVKKDYTAVFKPSALELQRVNAVAGRPTYIRQIDVNKSLQLRFKQLCSTIAEVEEITDLDRIVFMCHGTRRQLQLGVTRANVADFAKALPREPYEITLYACSAAGPASHSGDGHLADMLRDAVVTRFKRTPDVDVTVDAHATKGHATRNPYVRRFKRDGASTPGVGGRWIVEPGSALWPKWKRALQTDFRYKFPRMTIGEVHDYLAKMKR